jgi:hypothetical protein
MKKLFTYKMTTKSEEIKMVTDALNNEHKGETAGNRKTQSK